MRHAGNYAKQLWNNIGVVYPQVVYILWITSVEGVKRVENRLNLCCQIAKNRGKKILIHRLWGINDLVTSVFVDTVYKQPVNYPQLVHIVHTLIHKLSTGEEFSPVDH